MSSLTVLIKRIELLVLLVAMSATGLVVFAPSRTLAVAPPGCYIRQTNGDIQTASCPSSVTPEPNKCYVANLLSPGIGPYNETDCNTITVAGSGTPGDESFSFGEVNKDDCAGDTLNQNNCGVIKLLIGIINALAALVGVIVVAVIVWGGIQYSTSADDPKAVSEAKNRIKNAIFALVMFAFMYAFLQWIVPGGVL
ncbi:MAG: hypothetical protein KIH63_005215 [Candidatus Saccharibacteria bacterium]|nr:hypothetical protein [Candidatus Saccharibacteria bacterium]